jgi:hypothetical protein
MQISPVYYLVDEALTVMQKSFAPNRKQEGGPAFTKANANDLELLVAYTFVD